MVVVGGAPLDHLVRTTPWRRAGSWSRLLALVTSPWHLLPQVE